MSQHFEAIYDNGVLKPLIPLSLPDKTLVRLSVESQPGGGLQPQDEWERNLLGLAVDCAVSLPNTAVSSEGLYE